jgi:ornithine cyclodeaminase/alanine dehydrogenase-like protein (mu-crystallin family)
MPVAVEAMRAALAQFSAGETVVPPRAHLDVPEHDGVALFMPAHMPRLGRMAVKVINLFGTNPSRGLPRVHAVVMLFCAETGVPLALLDGGSLTAIRTGAAAGVATDLLARRDSRRVAVFGCGVQGRTQLEAVCCVRSVEAARVYDPDAGARERFAIEMDRELGIAVEPAERSAEALMDADIVCTATVSATPVFDDADMPPGAHINAIGSYKPHVQEIPSATVARARVVVDHRAGALEEPGDLLIPIAQGLFSPEGIHAEVGEILLGLKSGRSDAAEITLYKSVGVAVQDLAAASVALDRAEQLGIGSSVQL